MWGNRKCLRGGAPGRSAQGYPCNFLRREEGEARLNGFYAISKVTNERIAAGYQQAFGLPFVAVRYFNIYGPRQDYRRVHPPVISAFILKVLAGEAPVLFDGFQNNKRDFIYVDDINDFHIQCITDDRLNGNLYRLGSGKACRWMRCGLQSRRCRDPISNP